MKKRILLLFFTLLLVYASCTALSSDLVNPYQLYTYKKMCQDINELSAEYPDLIIFKSIGKTVYSREIWAVKLGKGIPSVMIDGSIHAREWISTNLCMEMIEYYAQAYSKDEMIGKYNVKNLLDKISIWYIPMVNPDGVTLQQKGITVFPKSCQKNILDMNKGKEDFSRWKANAQGIDLNQQYPTDWDKREYSVLKPYYKNFKGSKPLETLEARSIVKFIDEIKPEILINYHSSGRVLYWRTLYSTSDTMKITRRLAEGYKNISGYKLVSSCFHKGAVGLQDYFIYKYNKPSLTPELGSYVGERNVPVSEFVHVWERNKEAGLFIAAEGYKLWQKKKN